MSKFLLLTFFSILLTYVNCGCPYGHFTDASPCDTEATPIQRKKFTSISIRAGQWAYFYIPLKGIETNIQLLFKVNGPSPDGYLNFQPDTSDHLPTNLDNYYGFDAEEGTHELPASRKINGIVDFDEAIMVLGLYNRGSSRSNVQVIYFVKETKDKDDESRTLRKLIVGVIIGVVIAAVLLSSIGGYSMCMIRRLSRRRAAGITDIEAQNTADILSLEDLQKYFPKKPFKELQNPFQQTGCSVCLEDFLSDVSCQQFYCNHIFHETCVGKWVENHSSCPDCRVSIGKKAVEEFLKKQKENESIKVIDRNEIARQ